MSDLHAAVEAEIDAHRPNRVPPFDGLLARRRSRDRRRAGAAVAAVVLAALGLAFLPAALRPDGHDSQLADNHPPAATSRRFEVRLTTAAALPDAQAVTSCLALPGLSDLAERLSTPASYQVTVTGIAETAGFRGCIGKIDAAVLVEVPAPTKDGLIAVTGLLIANGGQQSAAQIGLAGQVVLSGPTGRFTADANAAGKFSLRVPPGTYTATGSSPLQDGGPGQCRADSPVAVSSADILGLSIVCPRR